MCVLPLQVDKYDKDHPESKDEVPDQRKTSLQGALDVFDKVRGRATWSPPTSPTSPTPTRMLCNALSYHLWTDLLGRPERGHQAGLQGQGRAASCPRGGLLKIGLIVETWVYFRLPFLYLVGD